MLSHTPIVKTRRVCVPPVLNVLPRLGAEVLVKVLVAKREAGATAKGQAV